MAMVVCSDIGEEVYQAIMSWRTPDGERHEEIAIYRGNPMRDPDATVLEGRDLMRGDNAIYMNSSGSYPRG